MVWKVKNHLKQIQVRQFPLAFCCCCQVSGRNCVFFVRFRRFSSAKKICEIIFIWTKKQRKQIGHVSWEYFAIPCNGDAFFVVFFSRKKMVNKHQLIPRTHPTSRSGDSRLTDVNEPRKQSLSGGVALFDADQVFCQHVGIFPT